MEEVSKLYLDGVPYQFSDTDSAMLSGFNVFYTRSAILPLKRLKRQRTTCDWQIYAPRRDIKLTTITLPDTYILGNSFLAKSPKRGWKEAEFIDIHGAEPNYLGFPTKYRIMLVERKAIVSKRVQRQMDTWSQA